MSGSVGVAVSKESPVSSARLLGDAVPTVGPSGETLIPVVRGGVLLKVVKSVDCATVLL